MTPESKAVAETESSVWVPIFLAWLIAVIGTLGSLFFSEVMKLPPCSLCWYQRIGLYPLVAIFTVGILSRDKNVGRYAWPLVAFGGLGAVYHLQLYYHLIPESITPCTAGVPCTTRQIEWLGFISIPLLSLFGFLSLGGCLFWFGLRARNIK